MMTKPLPLSLIKPPVADLAEELARAFARCTDAARMVTLNRLYLAMTPAAKARCDFARTLLALDAQS